VFPAYDEQAVRLEFWGDTVERITKIDPTTGNAITQLARTAIYPATHFVTERPTIERAVTAIRAELKERLAELRAQNKLLEAQRLESRTHFDIDMLLEVGRCTGIENYSRHLTGRAPGERPACLLDYFPDDYLCILDESHQTLPQVGGMYEGDRSRKQTLVDYGFRLPSALDNRPLRIDEFMGLVPRMVFVSATPGVDELRLSGGVVVEQIIRPAGERPGRRLVERDPAARAAERAGARHHAHETDGGGPHRLLATARRPGPLPAFGDRCDRTGRDHPRLAAR
jgi:excinuclease ABC subunit B